MLIEIKKIKDTRVKDESGSSFTNPIHGGQSLTTETILEESIDVWAIKSIRPFHRNGSKHSEVKGDISVVYLYGTGKRDTSEIHVQSNHKELTSEVNELRRIGVRPS